MTKLKKIFFVLLCTALFLTGCSEEAQDTDKPVQSENQTAETKKPADTEKKKPKTKQAENTEEKPSDKEVSKADTEDKGEEKGEDEEKKEELMKVHTRVQELTGYDMFLFRPPYGDYDNAVVNVAKDCGYYTIQWDVDSLDWKDYGVDSIIKTVTQHKHLGNGSIILCHNGAKFTAQALDTLIATLKNEGYTFVPISELIYREGYHMNHEGRQIKN